MSKEEIETYEDEPLTDQIPVWVPDEIKKMYTALADRKGEYRVKMANHMRAVMIPEIKRIWEECQKKKVKSS